MRLTPPRLAPYHAAVMAAVCHRRSSASEPTPPPTRLNPWEFARNRGQWLGSVPAARLPRLAGAVERLLGPAQVALQFTLDARGRCRIAGTARATARLACERCLSAMPREIVANIDMLAVRSDAAARQLTPEYDVCLLAQAETPIEALVEDDMLLSLPTRVCGEPEACPRAPARAWPPVAAPASKHPFSALAGLRQARPSARDAGNLKSSN